MLNRNGRRLRLNAGMAITIEILCYFIQHETRSVDDVLHDVFTHSTADQGRRYFHLIRSEICNSTMLEIKHDSVKKCYRLESNETLEWDMQHVMNKIRTGTVRPEDYALLLPYSSSFWVERERQKFENSFVAAMLERAYQLEAQGCHEENRILERMIRDFPMNENLLKFTVRHTARTIGFEAAEHQLEGIEKRFLIVGVPMPEPLKSCMTLH